MDSPAAHHHVMTRLALPDAVDVAFMLGHGLWWLLVHWYVPLALVLAGWAVWEVITHKVAAKASRERCVLQVTPAPTLIRMRNACCGRGWRCCRPRTRCPGGRPSAAARYASGCARTNTIPSLTSWKGRGRAEVPAHQFLR